MTDPIELLRLYINDPPGDDPFLSDTKLQSLLDLSDGEVEGAAAKAWRMKAADVSGWYLANIDGSFLSRDQVFDHCIKMAEFYELRSGTSHSMVNIELVGPNQQTEDLSSEF